MTGLVAFALYLPAFNLFLTSTAEERERGVLLALLLSPTRPAEILAAKAIFYTLASLLVSLIVVGLYRPALLGDPRLWLTIGPAAVGYVAIGTVVLCFVRRQTTIGTVSILYLMAVGVCITLAQVLPLFDFLRLF
jgi:ABC-type Na+ efflux pump permease subunit